MDIDRVVTLAHSQELRQRQFETFARMEPSENMTMDVFRQLAESPQVDYSSVRTILGAYSELAGPRTYLEIGTRRGHSLAMVVASAKQPVDVFSFDLWIENYAGEANPGQALVERELAKLGYQGRIRFFAGDSRVTVPAFFADPKNPQEVDCVFVDGDHTDEGARTDLENTVGRIAVGGMLVFDDITHPQHRSLLGVWERLMEGRTNFQTRVNTKHEYGWAIALRTR